MNTCIRYRYRDASNYKFHGAAVLAGTVTKRQIRPHLHEGLYFIPGDVGLASLHPTHCTFDEDLDHPWHELDGVRETEARPSTDLEAQSAACRSGRNSRTHRFCPLSNCCRSARSAFRRDNTIIPKRVTRL